MARKRLTQEEVIKRFKEKHGDMYGYSLVEYVSQRVKVDIICNRHGVFKQGVVAHIRGGCNKCGCDRMKKNKIPYDFKSKEDLKESYTKRGKVKIEARAKTILVDFDKIHKNFYSYSNMNYLGRLKSIKVTCPSHGDFTTLPSSHLNGSSCPRCQTVSGWSLDDWKKSAITAKSFDSFKLYVIKCTNENEKFYKIGRTFRTLRKRFFAIPYEVKILKVIEGDANYIFKLEKELNKNNKEYSYTPKINFGGKFECYHKLKTYINV